VLPKSFFRNFFSYSRSSSNIFSV